jgi:Omp85 superfamily domain
MQGRQVTIVVILACILSGLVSRGRTCLAQTSGQTSQTGGPLSSITNRVSMRERVVPNRQDVAVIDLVDKNISAISGGIPQGAGLTFGLQFSTADLFKWVEFRVSALTSTKLYRLFEGAAYFPIVGDENTHAEVWFSYLRRIEDGFFGIGPRIPNTSQTNFDMEQRSYTATLYRDFSKAVKSGIFVRVANTGTFNGEDDNDIPMNQLFSGDPNVVPITNWAPGFQTNTKILSYGVYGEWDARNNDSGLTRGFYVFGRFSSYDGLAYDNNPVFQDYGWLQTELDGRAYFPLFSDRTSLAVRAFTIVSSLKGGSQIPFYDMAFTGGRKYMRGFKNYRFRGNNLLLFSGEFRQNVWQRSEQQGLDIVFFADVAQVWGDNRSQTDPAVIQNKHFSGSNWRTGSGGGIQYRLSKSFAARVELGHSNERNLVYFSFSRGF